MTKKKGVSTDHVTSRDDSPALEDHGGPAGGSSAGGDQSPEPKRRGAPKGNRNNFQHGLNSKRSATENRDSHARRAERRVREMLKTWNVDGDPLGESVGDGLRTLHSALYRLTALGDSRGWVDRSGKPKPMLESTLSVIDRLLNNLTKLLDRVAELRSQANPEGDQEVRYLVETHDGIVVGASWDVAAELRAAGGILPITGPERVCKPPIAEWTGRPADPGGDLPLEATWTGYAPAQGDLSASETDSPSMSARPLLGARGTANAKSLDRKVARAVRQRPDDDPGVQRPGGVPEDAYFNGECWVWSRGDQTFMLPVVQRDRWTTIAEW